MLDSDFWRDLAERFRRVDPDGILQAGWILPFGQLSSELWEIFGIGDLGPSIRAQFEPLAIRAGLKLGGQSRSPLDVWLSALKAYGPQIELIGPPDLTVPHSGSIRKLCRISADYCNVLEKGALQTEHATGVGIQIPSDNLESPIESTILVPLPEGSVTPELAPPSVEIAHEPQISLSIPEPPPEHEPVPTLSETPSESQAPTSEGLPQPETSSLSLPNNARVGEQRRRQVDEFLEKCNAISSVRIFRRHIWQSVGHSSGRQFEYWQRGDPKASAANDLNFNRTLQMAPEDFLTRLKRKDLLK